uniref:AlNc14C300G10371 protein n=1 Tax=Albugo laibachii Nc14 TaxID=890382 RepID=F0WVN4_9STRA|nr:AlNc14C300G10371 [Albugo laibachii Nc14]|eukprot:CCA25478.1 AlNc14C300G10371 [Albugo laibachii Nc14]
MAIPSGAGSKFNGVSQPKGAKNTTVTNGRHPNPGNRHGIPKEQKSVFKREKKTTRQRDCLNCRSTDLTFFRCLDCDSAKAQELWWSYKSTWNAKSVGGVIDMGTINKTLLLEATIGGKAISVLADSVASVSIISVRWLNNFGDGSKCARKRLEEPIKLISFSGHIKKIREEAVVQLEFTTSEGRLQLAIVESMVSPNNLTGGVGELILSREVMSRIGFRPRCMVAEARRQSPFFDLQSDSIDNPEKAPLEVALSVVDTETLGEAVSAEVKDEWQDDFLQYTPPVDSRSEL